MNEFDCTEREKTYTPEDKDAYVRTLTPMKMNFPNYIPFEMCAFESTRLQNNL